MALLIDGYNLLNASAIVPQGAAAGTLEGARETLLDYLAQALDPQELRQATIVFDAKDAPPGLPDTFDRAGLTVRFSKGYEDADELLIELIRFDTAPRRLTVVSSDHRVQRAARRRRARAVDSEVWCAELMRGHRLPQVPLGEADSKPPAPLSQHEVSRWLREFGDVDASAEAVSLTEFPTPSERAVGTQRSGEGDAPPDGNEAASNTEAMEGEAPAVEPPLDEAKRLAAEDRSLANPFPPGYAEDLLEDEHGGRDL